LFDVREEANRESLVLFLTLYFTIKKHDIRGLVVVLMDLPSVVALKQIVCNFIDSVEKQADGNARRSEPRPWTACGRVSYGAGLAARSL
jgi:hypothetical protein